MRIEHDMLGERIIDEGAYYGIYTTRAVENFPLTGVPIHAALVDALMIVKKAAAITNREIGDLDGRIAGAIVAACDEILSGKFRDQFPVDSLQGGAGTSTNMNINEVLANRAIELLGGQKGDYRIVHPLDHVNLHQSTNDVVPTAIRIAAIRLIQPAIQGFAALQNALVKKEKAFGSVVKIGRTQLQDAVPVMLGQEFGAWAQTAARDQRRLDQAANQLCKVNLGGTAVGTGINAPTSYVSTVIERLEEISGIGLSQADDLMDSTQNADVFVETSGFIKAAAVDLTKIANDLRLLASGPNSGIGEIILPPVQAGSSIMPGKINPVICEAVNQTAFQIMADDLVITLAAQAGQLELNPFLPLIAKNLFDMLDLLGAILPIFIERCIEGIQADEANCRQKLKGWTLVTALTRYIGYDKASEIASLCRESGKSVQEIVLEQGLMDEATLNEVLSIKGLTSPRIPGKEKKGT